MLYVDMQMQVRGRPVIMNMRMRFGKKDRNVRVRVRSNVFIFLKVESSHQESASSRLKHYRMIKCIHEFQLLHAHSVSIGSSSCLHLYGTSTFMYFHVRPTHLHFSSQSKLPHSKIHIHIIL